MNNFASDPLNRTYPCNIKVEVPSPVSLIENSPAELTDHTLLERTRALVADEKRLLHLVLDHIREIEDRKLYAARGYSSLFSFVVEALGYDEASAYRRIAAVRAIRDVPAVKQKLQDESLTLSTVALVQGHLRTEGKSRPSSSDQKAALFADVEGKSKRQAERHLASLVPDSHAARPERQRPVTATRTELRLTVNAEFMQRLDRLRELHFHTDPFAKMEDLLGYALAIAIQKKEPLKSRTKKSVTPEKVGKGLEQSVADQSVSESNASITKTTTTQATNSPGAAHSSKAPSRYIPANVRRTVYQRDVGQCQYRDPVSRRLCLSRTGIEYDHVVPFALGGDSTVENLRCLCRTHNQWLARQQFGQAKQHQGMAQ